MAAKKFGGKNGALAIAGVGIDFASQDMEVNQNIEDGTAYGDGDDAELVSDGCREWTLTFGGFALYDAASTAPGLADVSDTPGAFTSTFFTGCTYTGNALISNLKISQTRRSGVTRVTGIARPTGAVTETWDETGA